MKVRPNGKCTVCRHAERGRLEMLAASGASQEALGRRFGVSHDALQRHMSRHVSQERKAQLVAGPVKMRELVERAAELGMSLLDYLAIMRSTLVTQFLAASEANDRHGTAQLAGRLTEVLRLQAQVSGELTRTVAPVTNNTLIMTSPIMADLQAMLITRLRPFPEARHAVMEGLRALSRHALPDEPAALTQLLEPAAHVA